MSTKTVAELREWAKVHGGKPAEEVPAEPTTDTATTTLAYVRWFDSSIVGGETHLPDQAADLLENESAGILIHECEMSIVIALDRCVETNGLRCSLCIPKVNVRSIQRFKANQVP
jgi:hypothetical protein